MDKKQNINKDKKPSVNLTWVYMAVIFILGFLIFNDSFFSSGYNKEVPYTEFQEHVAKHRGTEIKIEKNSSTAYLTIKPEQVRTVFKRSAKEVGKNPTVSTRYGSLDKLEGFVESVPGMHITYTEETNYFNYFLSFILPTLLLVGLWFLLFRRMGSGGGSGGIFSVGKSKARLIEKGEGTHVSFKDVAGQEGAKEEVKEIVDFLKNPSKYTELGGKIPKGALLVGPPGTGKTLLAKAVAGEAGVPFFSLSGSDFVEMFVGVGASRVRDLFRQAKEKAPSIVFIDEIDAIGRARSGKSAIGTNDERENTLNQLLTEMDGFGTNSGVIVMAATNRVEILDSALLRPGRFDRQIQLDLPELSERIAIFKVHLAPLKLDESLDVDFLARQTPGFSGADIANVCNEAALIAARHNSPSVNIQHFLDAIDRTIGGLEKKGKVMTAEEKRRIAIHEAGHASVSWLIEYGNPLVKVTIIPRGRALGAAWYLPEERVNSTQEHLLDDICSLVAGRAAEEIVTGQISTGALNDLSRATKEAFSIVAYYGMGKEVHNLCYYNEQDNGFVKPYSEQTAQLIDEEVKRIVNEQYQRAKDIILSHRDQLLQLADMLVEHEVVFTEDVEAIFGKRPWKSRTDELLEEQRKEEEGEDAAKEDKE